MSSHKRKKRRKIWSYNIDQTAKNEGDAIQTMHVITPRTLRPYYGKRDYKKISIGYARDIKDAEIMWAHLVNADKKHGNRPITL